MGGHGIEVIVTPDKVEGHQQEDPEMPMNPASVEGYGIAEAGNGAGGAVRVTADTATEIHFLKVRVPSGASANGSSPASITTEIDMLKTENAFLKLALEEAKEKLRNAEKINEGASEKAAGAVRPIRREPGNRGVAYARMRRLLLKDVRFLSEGFLAYLNIEDLGRCSAVCRRFKKVIYDPEIVIRCVESGGLTNGLRGLMWLIMVNMESMEASTSGLLSVVARHCPESPEEQYDRLHRAMNGTLTSPVKPSRTNTGDDGMSGGASANDKAAGNTTPEGTARKKLDGETGDGGQLSVFISDNSDSALDMEGEGNERGGADSGASVEGDASLGADGMLLWDDSTDSKATVGRAIKTRDSEAAAMARATVEAADAAYAAEAAAGIRPLGRSSEAGAAADVEDEEEEEHHSSAAEGFGVTTEATEKAWTRGDGVEAAALVEGNRGADSAPPSAGGSTTSVVGWASGLFRKTPGMALAATGENTGNSPAHTRKGSPSLTPEASRHNRRESGLSPEATSPTSRAGRGLLFGLRYGASRAKSELPANASPSGAATSFSSFFGDIGGKQKRQLQNSGGKTSSGDCASKKGANEDGDDGWPAVQRVPGLYAALLNSADAMDANDITGVRGPKQSCFVDIEKDLKRTLGMKDVSPLRNVLRCMSTFVPDVGYVQGMNFVCRSLLQVFDDEEEVFWVFVGMLQRFGLRRLYSPGMPLLRLRFFQLNRLLMWHLPDLFEHFESCGVHTNLFATSWFVTLLSDGGMLPDHEVKFVWDRIFLHATSPSSQWSPIFLLLLEMLRRASDALKRESRFSELIHRLVNMPFRELCEGRGASSMITEAGRRFETSSPMPVQLLLLHDQWEQGRGEEGLAEGGDEKQLL